MKCIWNQIENITSNTNSVRLLYGIETRKMKKAQTRKTKFCPKEKERRKNVLRKNKKTSKRVVLPYARRRNPNCKLYLKCWKLNCNSIFVSFSGLLSFLLYPHHPSSIDALNQLSKLNVLIRYTWPFHLYQGLDVYYAWNLIFILIS